jgi:hypothetical protein
MNRGEEEECKLLVEKTEGKRPLGRPKCRLMYNIKVDHRVTAFGGSDEICLAEDRDKWRSLVNAVMNLRVP